MNQSQRELLDMAESHEQSAQAGDPTAAQKATQVLAQMLPPGALLAPMVGPGGAARVWPKGVRILHIYGLMRRTAALDNLSAAGHEVAGDLMAVVPPQWWHWTAARIEDATTDEAQTIATTLKEHLADRPARWRFDAQAALDRHAILITPTGDAPPLTTLMHAAQAAMRSVDPDAQRTRTPKRAHSSLAYNTTAVRGLGRREVAALSDQFGIHHLEIELEAAAVVWVMQEPDGPAYTWDLHTRIPLLGG